VIASEREIASRRKKREGFIGRFQEISKVKVISVQ
jgi:hypothetical protein